MRVWTIRIVQEVDISQIVAQGRGFQASLFAGEADLVELVHSFPAGQITLSNTTGSVEASVFSQTVSFEQTNEVESKKEGCSSESQLLVRSLTSQPDKLGIGSLIFEAFLACAEAAGVREVAAIAPYHDATTHLRFHEKAGGCISHIFNSN